MTAEEAPITPFMMRRRGTLPTYDGTIAMQSNVDPVQYHILACLATSYSEQQIRELAMHVCHISCVTIEILRRRQPSGILAKFAERECIERIENMRLLLTEYMQELSVMHQRHIYPPVEFLWINGVLKSERTFDASVAMRVGNRSYLGSLVLERRRNRWICLTIDIG